MITIAMLYACKAQAQDLFGKWSCKIWPVKYDVAVAVDSLHEQFLDANMCQLHPTAVSTPG